MPEKSFFDEFWAGVRFYYPIWGQRVIPWGIWGAMGGQGCRILVNQVGQGGSLGYPSVEFSSIQWLKCARFTINWSIFDKFNDQV